MIGIGIDTGGTCTDAVAYNLDTKEVLAFAKSMTTHEKLEIGIGESIAKLPRKLIDQASYISLSTTLATNACVENKGGRVCLVFIGVKSQTVLDSYEKYGFEGTDFMRFLDGNASKGIAPDWSKLEEMLPEILEEYDSIAISQMLPRDNNGQYEKDAREIIWKYKKIPVICAYEIFKDLNVIKRGAGALLNARLIPVIDEFFKAVHKVLEQQNINLPFLIMRSDGSLVSEQYSMKYPVETLLCGPTASAKGAAELLPESQAIVVDMGGTTSDIALIKNGEPKIDLEGVSVGGWETFVRGIDIDTFALGGDTWVRYHDQDIFLDDRRVMPVSVLAGLYPETVAEMEKYAGMVSGSVIAAYEHFILMQDISGREQFYNETEIAVCRALKNGPLGIRQLSAAINRDPFTLNLERLEKEGIIQRAGFTPTDAMVLKGDRKDLVCSKDGSASLEKNSLEENDYKNSPAYLAAYYATEYISKSTEWKRELIADEVYRLVKERLYCNLVRILWKDSEGKLFKRIPEELHLFAKKAFEDEYKGSGFSFFKNSFTTDAVLLGVGAPVHLFLEDVAKALHTKAKVSEYSGVSNALGALLGDACVYETVYVRVQNDISLWDEEGVNFLVQGDKVETFSDIETALKRAEEIAKARAEKKLYECGAGEMYSLTAEMEEKKGATNLGSIPLGGSVTACAKGRYIF